MLTCMHYAKPVMLSRPRDLTDDVILEIAKGVPPGKCHDLGVRLGFPDTDIDTLISKHEWDIDEVSREVLMGWKTCHGSGPAVKRRLSVHLESIGLESLAAHLTPMCSPQTSPRPLAPGLSE